MKRHTCFLLASLPLLTIASAPQAQQPSITWSPSRIERSVRCGVIVYEDASFWSSDNLTNVVLEVEPSAESPALGPFVTLVPNSFATVSAGAANDFSVRISAPLNCPGGVIYRGAVHLRMGKKMLSAPLELALRF